MRSTSGEAVSVAATPLLRADGVPVGGVMVIRDETPLLELEKSLAETRRFSKIVGQSPPMRRIQSMIDALGDVQEQIDAGRFSLPAGVAITDNAIDMWDGFRSENADIEQ